MGVLEQIRDQVEAYETAECKTEIVAFERDGDRISEGEKFKFKVKVTNDGQLDMKNVKVKVSGTTYADVAATFGGPYGGLALSSPFNLPAGHPAPSLTPKSHTTGYFYGLAKTDTGGVAKDIVTARIESWDASWDHILTDHTERGEPEAILHEVIDPD